MVSLVSFEMGFTQAVFFLIGFQPKNGMFHQFSKRTWLSSEHAYFVLSSGLTVK